MTWQGNDFGIPGENFRIIKDHPACDPRLFSFTKRIQRTPLTWRLSDNLIIETIEHATERRECAERAGVLESLAERHAEGVGGGIAWAMSADMIDKDRHDRIRVCDLRANHGIGCKWTFTFPVTVFRA